MKSIYEELTLYFWGRKNKSSSKPYSAHWICVGHLVVCITVHVMSIRNCDVGHIWRRQTRLANNLSSTFFSHAPYPTTKSDVRRLQTYQREPWRPPLVCSLAGAQIYSSNESLTQENTLEIVSDTESKRSGPAKESWRCNRSGES